MIAGPRVLEHMVDTVLYFEGERGHQFRILRAVKNRFGATDEIGVFEMSDRGPRRGAEPVGAVPRRAADEHGASAAPAVFAGIEGTRPVLVEIQALVAPSLLGTPRRAVVGWDATRLAMILAVLEARCGLRSAPTTYTSTSPAACASTSRPPIWRSPRRWSRRWPTSRCRPIRSSSARSAWRPRAAGVAQRRAAEGSGEARLHRSLAAAPRRRPGAAMPRAPATASRPMPIGLSERTRRASRAAGAPPDAARRRTRREDRTA